MVSLVDLSIINRVIAHQHDHRANEALQQYNHPTGGGGFAFMQEEKRLENFCNELLV